MKLFAGVKVIVDQHKKIELLTCQDVFAVTDVFTGTNLMQNFDPFSRHVNLRLKPAPYHTDLGLASSTKIPHLNR